MKREVKIGVFAVAMLLCAWAGIRFLGGIDLFSRNRVYYAAYDSINGVQTASPIFIKGVKVGTVTGIAFDPSRSDDVVLELTVKRQYGIPADSEAKIFSDGFLGAKAIEIVLGRDAAMLAKGDTIRSSRSRDIMDVAGSEIEFLKQKVAQLTSDLSVTLANVNALVEENAADIHGTMSHLNSISGNLDSVLSTERESLRAAVRSLSEFSQALGDNAAQVDSMLTGLGRFSTSLAESGVAENLSRTADELNTMLGRLNEGDGSLGRLLNDRELYESLTEASGNLSNLLADLKEHPKRYVHFSLFGRSEAKELERQAKREAKAEEKRLRDSLAAAR